MFRTKKQQQESIVKSIDSNKELKNSIINKKNMSSKGQQNEQQVAQAAAAAAASNENPNNLKSENNTKRSKSKKSEIVGKHEVKQVTNEKSPRVIVVVDENVESQAENIPRVVKDFSSDHNNAVVVANHACDDGDYDHDDDIINNNKNNNNNSSDSNNDTGSGGRHKRLSCAQFDNKQITQQQQGQEQIDQVRDDGDDGDDHFKARSAITTNEQSELQLGCNNNESSPTSHKKSNGPADRKNSQAKLLESTAGQPSSSKQHSPSNTRNEEVDSEIIYDNCDIIQEKCNTEAAATKTTTITKSPALNTTTENSKGQAHESDAVEMDLNNANVDPNNDKIECSKKVSKEEKKISRDEAKRIEKDAKKLKKQLAKESKKLSKSNKNGNSKNKVKDDKTNNKHIKDNNKENKEVKPLTQAQPILAEQSTSSTPSSSLVSHQAENGNKQKPADKTIKELKIFQDHKLINQLDPMKDLKNKLNALNSRDNFDKQQLQTRKLLFTKNQSTTHPPKGNNNSFTIDENQPIYGNQLQSDDNNIGGDQEQDFYYNVTSKKLANHINVNNNKEIINHQDYNDGDEDDFTTIKKGVLWVQQNYDKLSSKIFSRWKKRYFILTTDYFVCFKRSQSKVGHSEMGSFIYKASLSDITKIGWVKENSGNKKHSTKDKGPLILHIRDKPNMLLWSKDSLEDWCLLTREAIKRSKLRRACHQTQIEQLHQQNHHHQQQQPAKMLNECQNSPKVNADDQLYENSPQLTNEIHLPGSVGVPPAKPLSLSPQQKQQQSNETDTSQKKQVTNHDLQDNTTRSNSRDKNNNNNKNHELEQHQPIAATRSSTSPASQLHQQQQRCNSSEPQTSNGSGGARKLVLRPRPDPKVPEERADDDVNVDMACSELKQEDNQLHGSASTENRNELQKRANANGTSSVAPDKNLARSNNNDINQKRQEHEHHRENNASDIDKDNCDALNGGSNKEEPNCDNEQQDHVLSAPEPPPRKPAQQQTNLIRRDDSWQSLVSLNRVGRNPNLDANNSNNNRGCSNNSQNNNNAAHIGPVSATPQHLGQRQQHKLNNHTRQEVVARRSLYARETISMDSGQAAAESAAQHKLNIEASVTPSRAGSGAALRHQQQSSKDANEFLARRKMPALGHQQESASFDMGLASGDQKKNQHLEFRNRDSTCQRKLLQLQLLQQQHQIQSGGDPNADYQIYEGADTSFQHYGHFGGAAYSSMRSNLKTATSEFAFIRPSSNNNNNNQASQIAHDSTLDSRRQRRRQPQQAPAGPLMRLFANNNKSDNTSDGHQIGNQITQTPIRSSLVFNDTNNSNHQGELQQQHPSSTCMPMMNGTEQQILINENHPIKTISNPAPHWSGHELPMKPNKRRKQQPSGLQTCEAGRENCNASIPKSSSLTSSIASFFRRAFSGRQRRNANRKDSSDQDANALCSISLGDGSNHHHRPQGSLGGARSAFSTGGKSDSHHDQHQQHQISGGSDFAPIITSRQQQHQKFLPMAIAAQSPRMVDMIEAFQNNTRAAQLALDHEQQAQHQLSSPLCHNNNGNNMQWQQPQSRAKLIGLNLSGGVSSHQIAQSPEKFNHHQQNPPTLASPLHKSNSVSVTLNAAPQHQQGSSGHPIARTLLDADFLPATSNNNYNNDLQLHQHHLPSPRLHINSNHQHHESSLIMSRRSNLQPISNSATHSNNGTPIMSRKSGLNDPNLKDNNFVKTDYQPSAQPRRSQHAHVSAGHNIPRPSSIYGQPSLISSPSIHSTGHYQRNSLVGFPGNSGSNHHLGDSSTPMRIRPSSNDFTNYNNNNHPGQHHNGFGLFKQVNASSNVASQLQQHQHYLDPTCEELNEDSESPTRENFGPSLQQSESSGNFMIDIRQQNRDFDKLGGANVNKRNSYLASNASQDQEHQQIQHQQRLSSANQHRISSSTSCSPLIIQNNISSSRQQQQNYRTRQAAIVNPILQDSPNCFADENEPNQQQTIIANSIYDNHPDIMNLRNIGDNRASVQDFMLHHQSSSSYDQNRHLIDQQQQHQQSHYDNHAPLSSLDGRVINQDVDPYTIRQLNTVVGSPLNHNRRLIETNSQEASISMSAYDHNKRHLMDSNNPVVSSPLAISQFKSRQQQQQQAMNSSPLMEPRRSATNSALSEHGVNLTRQNIGEVAAPVYPFRSPLMIPNNIDNNNNHNAFSKNFVSPRIATRGELDGQNGNYYDNQFSASPNYSLNNDIINNNNKSGRAVVNIAGAPGINLDPILAASLLEGTQIDAYQSLKISPSIDNYQMNSKFANGDSNSSATNKFLVSDRVSKSIANRKSLGNAELSNLANNHQNHRHAQQSDSNQQQQDINGWNSSLSNDDHSSSAASSSSRTNHDATARSNNNNSSKESRRKSSTTTTGSGTSNTANSTDRSQDDQSSSHHSTTERKQQQLNVAEDNDNNNCNPNRIQGLRMM